MSGIKFDALGAAVPTHVCVMRALGKGFGLAVRGEEAMSLDERRAKLLWFRLKGLKRVPLDEAN
ncbi:hypothetical protein TWF281_003085 [Arthrobotrys megalospora]